MTTTVTSNKCDTGGKDFCSSNLYYTNDTVLTGKHSNDSINTFWISFAPSKCPKVVQNRICSKPNIALGRQTISKMDRFCHFERDILLENQITI